LSASAASATPLSSATFAASQASKSALIHLAGNCEHSWQTDRAGHICGRRSTDSRSGPYHSRH
jgi:hypothetical protein